jgi:hypothetical protein
MKEYNKKRGLGNLENTNVITTFSFKPFATSPEEVCLGNSWVPVLIRLPLVENLDRALKEAKKGF